MNASTPQVGLAVAHFFWSTSVLADVDAVLDALSRGLTQKMLHGAMAELHAGDAAAREQTAQTVSKLFLRSQSKSSL